jgi:hypothetical protein
MARSIRRNTYVWLTMGLLSAAVSTASAQTDVVSFTGSNATSTISGSFDYWQQKTMMPGHTGMFIFTGDMTHPYGVAYTITTGSLKSSVTEQGGTEINQFTIDTAANPTTLKMFLLNTTFGSTTVTIILNTNTTLSTRNLPATSVFTTSPPTIGTFTQKVGSTTTAFNISVSGMSTAVTPFSAPPPIHYVSYEVPAPVPAAPCAYRPRPACCLSRLFGRRRCP